MCDNVQSWIEIGMLMAGISAVVVAVWSHRKATYAQVVTHYAERFSRVRAALQVASDAQQPTRRDLANDPELRPFLDYFDLTYEEWYMARHRYLPGSLWHFWKKDVGTLMRTAAVRTAWTRAKAAYHDDEDFYTFMEGLAHGDSRG